MCTTCGCSDGARPTLTDPATGRTWTLRPRAGDGHAHAGAGGRDHGHPDHDHEHDDDPGHDDEHARAHGHAHGRTVAVEEEILAANDRVAERNRGWLAGRNILALNLVSSPGAGKTALLERTIRELGASVPVSVVEGDQETAFDAERIRATGCRTVQVNTGTGCHLEADMLARALRELDPPADSLLLIENVGNLVCPALFDLGEAAKVTILSVTEGADKPLKYPHMFRASRLMVLNKTDLLPYVDFDVEACVAHARRVNPDIEVLRLSATTGAGMDAWHDWLRTRMARGGLEAVS